MLKRLINGVYLCDSEGDSGGSGISVEEFEKLGEAMKTIAEGQEDVKKSIEETHTKVGTITADNEAELAKLSAEVGTLKTMLKKNYGASGAEDWTMEFSKFLSGIYHMKNGNKAPDCCKLSNGVTVEELLKEQKTAASFTTTTDATAGFLVPDILMPGIIELKDLFGSLYPLLTKVTVAAGQSLKMNKDAANPVASWRSAQAGDMTLEATPMSFGQDVILTELLGTYIEIANELLNVPGTNFGAVATARMVKAILRGVEFGVLSGTAAGVQPTDGVIATATDQGNIATTSFANVVTFLQACIADNAYAASTSDNTIFMTPTDKLALAAQAVGASELTGMLVWGDPRTGAPDRLLGYRLVDHPSMNNGTNKHIALGDPSTITLGEDASFSIDINPHLKDAYIANASWLRVFNHYDWALGQGAEWHMATVGAT